ncbi:hypothetical protein SSX86_017923 [Deinandra increscens subsp. villosa]|uniref:Cyclin-dependent protein kinase inhibitor SMR1-like n=1 Tax=Deinandra increscens subsp. villosa TaxID=3103831 RepID=A0AAP0GW62_9ASTR
MSADLQFRRQDLPPIQLSSLTLNLPPPENESSCRIEPENSEEECVTPTSPESRIPAVLSCPPAPKKQRRAAPSCKRRICEFQFFEVVAGDEIDAFFRSSYEFINQNSSKRRRCPL